MGSAIRNLDHLDYQKSCCSPFFGQTRPTILRPPIARQGVVAPEPEAQSLRSQKGEQRQKRSPDASPGHRSCRGRVVAAVDGGSVTSDTGLLLRLLDQRLSLFGLAWATDPLAQVTRPAVHQNTPAVEQVEAGMGCLDPVADRMRQCALTPAAVRCGRPTVHPPSPRRPAMGLDRRRINGTVG